MPKAIWNDAVLAESDNTKVVESNHYFPPESINEQYFSPASKTSSCPWKGLASYFDLEVEGETNPTAAWSYRDPKEAASEIKDHVAFWNGVKVE